ncbi:Ankyrin repeat domain-containing protein 17 [Talaromyces islandicus]|uniref:Ankyrin repeat domain-containing protein 17 n=1 Tax=Talaromyces islandicus TaxID=28573 RepID=A0A0U1LUQ1_TALIS|nr:Ankyrin repeat domain-containing protein 17 [Talaromyces islandicus]
MDIYRQVRSGNLTSASLDKYLETNDINATDSNGWTLLATAVRAGKVKMVELLLPKANPDKKSNGYTPLHLAVNAKAERAQIVRLLLDKKPQVNERDPDGNTAIITAIEVAPDADVIKLLRREGADLDTIRGKSGKTARELANASRDSHIQQAVRPDPSIIDRLSAVAWIVNVIVGMFRYALQYLVTGRIFGIFDMFRGRPRPPQALAPAGHVSTDADFAEAINHPKTEADFLKGVNNYVEEAGLEKFFSPDSRFLKTVAEKAAKLKDDPRNRLEPDKIKDLTRVALYQPVLYCDDSGSMQSGDRMKAQREIVKRIVNIATKLVPDDKGVHLRFINRSDSGLNDLREDAIEAKMQFLPSGSTPIGTELEAKILKPFIYDVLNGDANLERPYLIMTITDGCPTEENTNRFETAVIECGNQLINKGYERTAVRFQISQIGFDQEADTFLRGLTDNKPALKQVLQVTAQKLDKEYEALQKNERQLEEWLLKLLISPITDANHNLIAQMPDSQTPQLPVEFYHEDQSSSRIPQNEQPNFNWKSEAQPSIESAIVQLEFSKSSERGRFGGNGFFIDIPGATQRVILTAAHNLIDKTGNRSANMTIKMDGSDTRSPVNEDQIHICPNYERNPATATEASDWGLIFAPDVVSRASANHATFGFALKLAYEERLDCDLRVTGFLISNNGNGSSQQENKPTIGKKPVTSTGTCLNPILNPVQLEYTAKTEGGISGSPVWTMYNGFPTVLAIHNNGSSRRRSSRGTRLNLEVLKQIYAWAKCEMLDQLIKVECQSQVPLYLTYSPTFGILRVVVKEADDPQLMRFNILPVFVAGKSAGEDGAKDAPVLFGLYQEHDGQVRWVSWNEQFGTATLVSDLRGAGLARGWQQQKAFQIIVDPHGDGESKGKQKDSWELIALINKPPSSQLSWEGEEFSILSFRKFLKGKRDVQVRSSLERAFCIAISIEPY